MSDWSKFQWFFHDFLILFSRTFYQIPWFFRDPKTDLNFSYFSRAAGPICLKYGCTVEVWKCISNCIPYFVLDVITYPYYDKSLSMLVKGAPDCIQINEMVWLSFIVMISSQANFGWKLEIVSNQIVVSFNISRGSHIKANRFTPIEHSRISW